MLMMRALIPASGTPPLDFGKGVLGKTVLMMLFGGAAWGTGNPSCGGDFLRKRVSGS